jgi:branched-chain amino acid transport system substrate-binding protein
MTNASNFALVTALKQAGINLKVVTFPTGYEADIIGTPAWQSVQGDFFLTNFRPTSLPNAGTVQMANALLKYQGRKLADFPSFNIYESWVATDLMLKGIELAGASPTSAKVIKALHGVTSYNADGILPISYNYSLANFGKGQSKVCEWFMEAKPKGFSPVSATPMCGTFAPGSTSKTAP